MAKAALAAAILLTFPSSVGGQEPSESPACSAEDSQNSATLEKCEGLRAAALLQVQRNQRVGVQLHETTGSHGKPQISAFDTMERSNEDSQSVGEYDSMEDDEPVTKKELLRHTKPMQSQIDSLDDRVTALEGSGGESSGGGGESGGGQSGGGESSGGGGESNQDGSGADESQEEESSERDLHSKDYYPDWDGLAPAPHWNGLEEVKATDRGPDASWKGKGTGVVTGKSYSGEYPYERMMDVDYLIDSNPGGRPGKGSRPEGKEGPSHGGKNGPSSGGKNGPRDGGKQGPRPGGKSGESDAKNAPKPGGKSGEQSGKQGPKSGGKSGESEAKIAPKEGGKGKEADEGALLQRRHHQYAKRSPRHGAKSHSWR